MSDKQIETDLAVLAAALLNLMIDYHSSPGVAHGYSRGTEREEVSQIYKRYEHRLLAKVMAEQEG